LTAQEYLELERKAEFKSEFYNGEMFAMSGGTGRHSDLAAALIMLLRLHLRGKRCKVYTSDLRLLVEADELYTYPDVSVVCGETKFVSAASDVFVNPILLVEVLSPSTEQYDRGTKAKLYRSIPTLRELLLVAQDKPEVEIYRRADGGQWTISTVTSLDSILHLESIDYDLSLRELYET
jgi:Uma2 family endonuclease